jgi:phospholipase/carboxylesterase
METAARSRGNVGATLVPTAYEPNYEYPLIVGFHGRGGNEMQAIRWLERISDRNYVGFCPRGSVMLDRIGRYGWSEASREGHDVSARWNAAPAGDRFRKMIAADIDDPTVAGEFAVLDQLRSLQSEIAIHPNRVYLFGVGEGASMAYRLALSFPDRFAGVIAIQGWLPNDVSYLTRCQESRRLKFLALHGEWDDSLPLCETRRQIEHLRNAGLDVAFQTYPSEGLPVGPMFDDINTWLMSQFRSTVG